MTCPVNALGFMPDLLLPWQLLLLPIVVVATLPYLYASIILPLADVIEDSLAIGLPISCKLGGVTVDWCAGAWLAEDEEVF